MESAYDYNDDEPTDNNNDKPDDNNNDEPANENSTLAGTDDNSMMALDSRGWEGRRSGSSSSSASIVSLPDSYQVPTVEDWDAEMESERYLINHRF